MCTERINVSVSINIIIKSRNEHKMEWGDSVVLRPCRGAHGCAVISDGEDAVMWLNRPGRGSSGGFNRDEGLWRTW
jgi:hypothetical protein